MQFTTQTQFLRQALAAATATIPSKPIIQVLNNVLLEVSDGEIAVTASNSEQTITMRDRAITEDRGAFLINARDLKGIVGAAEFDDIVFNLDADSGMVNIQCGFSEYTLPTFGADDYPTMTFGATPTATIEMSSNDLRNVLSKVSHAVGSDDLRPQLKGVCLNFGDNKLTAVATDTRVLAKSFVNVATDAELRVIIPQSAVASLQGSFMTEPNVCVTLYNNGCIFTCGGNSFTTVLVKGNFPDYNRVIPQTHTREAQFSRKLLNSALNAVSVMSDSTGLVKLEFRQTECVVSVATDAGARKSSSVCKCTLQGEPMKIAFNIRYLQSSLKTVEAEDVRFQMTDADRPAVLFGEGDDSTLNLLMPMRSE